MKKDQRKGTWERAKKKEVVKGTNVGLRKKTWSYGDCNICLSY